MGREPYQNVPLAALLTILSMKMKNINSVNKKKIGTISATDCKMTMMKLYIYLLYYCNHILGFLIKNCVQPLEESAASADITRIQASQDQHSESQF